MERYLINKSRTRRTVSLLHGFFLQEKWWKSHKPCTHACVGWIHFRRSVLSMGDQKIRGYNSTYTRGWFCRPSVFRVQVNSGPGILMGGAPGITSRFPIRGGVEEVMKSVVTGNLRCASLRTEMMSDVVHLMKSENTYCLWQFPCL
jgi:hypothetical protein